MSRPRSVAGPKPRAVGDVLTLPYAFTPAAAEDAFLASHTLSDRIVIDLTKCEHIEVAALSHLIARSSFLSRSGREIQLTLPRSRRMRAALRAWRFPSALAQAIDGSLSSLLNEESSKVVEDFASDVDYYEEPLFPYETVKVPNYDALELVEHLIARWRTRYVESLLSRHIGLNRTAHLITRNVVSESLRNAATHPNAQIMQTAGDFDRQGPRETTFDYSVWDDGESIVGSLQRALSVKGSLHPLPYEELHRQYKVSAQRIAVSGTPEATQQFTMSTAQRLEPGASRVELLLASTFPGVTGSLSTHDGLPLGSKQSSLGLGLFFLVNSAIDVLGGIVALRTENLHLTISGIKTGGQPKKDVYPKALQPLSLSLRELPKESNSIAGNLLTVRIPRYVQ